MSSLENEVGFGHIKIMILAVALIIAVVFTLSQMIAIVPAGNRGVLLVWSAIDGVQRLPDGEIISTKAPLGEGLHFITPFQDKVMPIEVRTKKVESVATGASKDLQDVSSTIAVNYHINPDAVHVLWAKVGGDYESRVISPAVQETVKQITAQFNAEELVTKRDTVKHQIEDGVRKRLEGYSLVTEQISITNFQFSAEFTQAIEQKVVAEQSAQKAKNVLTQIEIEAQQAKAKAIGEADANIARAEGEAQAIKTINDALANNPNYMEWLNTQKWNGQLPQVTGGAIPFVNIPSIEHK